MNEWPETSESLILRMKDPADAAAWSVFLAIYRPVVYRLARSRGLQDADADDLAQQVFVSISRSVASWAPAADGPPFRAWLYRIAHNEILKAITRRKPTWQPVHAVFRKCSTRFPNTIRTRASNCYEKVAWKHFVGHRMQFDMNSRLQRGPCSGNRQSRNRLLMMLPRLTVEPAELSTWHAIA